MPHNKLVNLLVQESYQKPVVVTFVAEWMGSSFILETYLKELSAHKEDLKFSFIDSDEQAKIAAYFDVKEIPTTLYLQNGEIVGRFSKLMSKRRIELWLDGYRKKKSPEVGRQPSQPFLSSISILTQFPPKPAELTSTLRIGPEGHRPVVKGSGPLNSPSK